MHRSVRRALVALPLAVLALATEALATPSPAFDPGRGLTISLVGASGQVLQTTTTDDDGVFRLLGVPAGTYSIHIDGAAHSSRSRTERASGDGAGHAAYDFFVKIEGTRASARSPRDGGNIQLPGPVAAGARMTPVGRAVAGAAFTVRAELTVSRGAPVAIRGAVLLTAATDVSPGSSRE